MKSYIVKFIMISIPLSSYAFTRHKLPLNFSLKDINKYHLVIEKKTKLTNNKIKYKLRQLINNIPIYNHSISITTYNNHIESQYGYIFTDLPNNIIQKTTSLTSNQAVDLFQKAIMPTSGNTIKHNKSSLFYRLNEKKAFRLIYRTSYYADGVRPERRAGIIDAKTGRILTSWDGLNTLNAGGAGGNVKIGKYEYAGTYPPLIIPKNCRLNAAYFKVFNMENSTTEGEIFKFSDCKDNLPINNYKEVNGAFSPINDAYFFSRFFFIKYRELFNELALQKRPTIKVHYGKEQEISFWDGESIVLGDGKDTLYPLTSLDVISHEIAHAITEENSALENIGEAGAINESFSDITSVLMKDRFNKLSEYRRWEYGESIMKGPRKQAIRYLDDPTKDGVSIKHLSDYKKDMDVHHAAGVFNHAFYLLSNMKGWNVRKAYLPFLIANQYFWTEESTFESAACDVMRANKDLNRKTKDVIASFEKVGINASCEANPDGHDIELKNNTPIGNIFGSKDSKKNYFIFVPYGKKMLNVTIKGSNGDADLYIRRAKHPTFRKFDCAPFKEGSNESCTFIRPAKGRYYIMLHGYTDYSSLSIIAEYL